MGKLIAIILVTVCVYLGWKGVTSFNLNNDAKRGAVTVTVDKTKAHEVAMETKAASVKTVEVSKKVADKSAKVFAAVSQAMKDDSSQK